MRQVLPLANKWSVSSVATMFTPLSHENVTVIRALETSNWALSWPHDDDDNNQSFYHSGKKISPNEKKNVNRNDYKYETFANDSDKFCWEVYLSKRGEPDLLTF